MQNIKYWEVREGGNENTPGKIIFNAATEALALEFKTEYKYHCYIEENSLVLRDTIKEAHRVPEIKKINERISSFRRDLKTSQVEDRIIRDYANYLKEKE